MPEKPKVLPPTLREKKRYLAYQVISPKDIPLTDLYNAIWFSILNLLGEAGAAKANIWLGKDMWNDQKKIGIIKCSHVEVENVRAALTLINRIGDIPVIIHVLGISGTIRGARRKFFGEVLLSSFG
ncbi:MAG: Rpp14/Pop5 family protein [Candidatus Aenigmatarchaeota archaeon]|nr:ribonuclease P protein component 2 [Candidatus Aenigmarchaeota archaeon]